MMGKQSYFKLFPAYILIALLFVASMFTHTCEMQKTEFFLRYYGVVP